MNIPPAHADRPGGEESVDLLAELPEGAQTGPRQVRQGRHHSRQGHSGLLQQLGAVRRRAGKMQYENMIMSCHAYLYYACFFNINFFQEQDSGWVLRQFSGDTQEQVHKAKALKSRRMRQ